MIDKSLKRRIFVDAQYNKFVQCVSPTFINEGACTNCLNSIFKFKIQIIQNWKIEKLFNKWMNEFWIDNFELERSDGQCFELQSLWE